MKFQKLIFVSLFCIPFITYAQHDISVLAGTWKVEGRESYEVWEHQGDGLKGYAYKMNAGQQIIKETLNIEIRNGVPVYSATVPDQNEGSTIPFTLNTYEKDGLSFENLGHDFPVKIRYKPESEDRLFVEVLGADGKGFSFYMDRVD